MSKAPLRILLLLCGLGIAEALSSYTTNCTLPPDSASKTFFFVSTPNVRGSLQIVWLCLSTLIICCYQVLHLNVNPGRRFAVLRDAAWSLLAVAAPEIILYGAILELVVAKQALGRFQSSSKLSGCKMEWTLTHMFYVNAFGVVLRKDSQTQAMDVTTLLETIEKDLVSPEPPLTSDEIMDKSKDSAFARGIAILQLLYFYVEFFARMGSAKAVTQLELSVASIAIYSVITYICLWHKPKGVGVPTYVQVPELLTREREVKVGELMDREAGTYRVEVEVITFGFPHELSEGLESLVLRWFGSDFLLCLISIPLGAVHLAAWNFEFPTVPDMWVWRISSILCTAVVPVAFIFLKTPLFAGFGMDDTVLLIITAIYVLARMAITIECIRCLFFLPQSAFEASSWAASLPHFG